ARLGLTRLARGPRANRPGPPGRFFPAHTPQPGGRTAVNGLGSLQQPPEIRAPARAGRPLRVLPGAVHKESVNAGGDLVEADIGTGQHRHAAAAGALLAPVNADARGGPRLTLPLGA